MQRWEVTLTTVLRKHNGFTANRQKVCSYATQRYRGETLKAGFRYLRTQGFKLKAVQGFRGKHMQNLVSHWKKKVCQHPLSVIA